MQKFCLSLFDEKFEAKKPKECGIFVQTECRRARSYAEVQPKNPKNAEFLCKPNAEKLAFMLRRRQKTRFFRRKKRN